MTKKLWLSIAALAIGAGLLVAAGFASPASSKNAVSSSKVAKTGGTLRINLVSDTDYVDPALAYYQISWQFEYATCAKLLNYPDKDAPAGSQLIADAATGLPRVSSDGKTYTFTVRPGWKSNTGETLTAANFADAINRDLNPKMQSPAASFITDIAGAQAVLDGKAATASGVKASGMTLSVSLTKPAPDFSARIAMPFFCAIPKGTPIVPEGVQKLDSFGPYYTASYTPNRQITFNRNTNYKGPRPHNFDKMVYTVGVSQEASLLQIKQDQADYAADGLAPTAYADLGAKYGLNKTQFFVKPTLSFRYLALNTTRPLFKGNVDLRRAVAYAIDRPALLRQYGQYAGIRATHYLPPGINGYVSQNLYPLKGSDYGQANKLAKGHTGDGNAVLYTCNRTTCVNSSQILQFNLKQIGVNLDIKQFARGVQFQKEGVRGEPFDIGFEGWNADYADPFDFINILLDGTTIHETNNVNFSYFNDPAYNKKMQDAAKLSGAARYQAYGKLDIDIAAHQAPLAAFMYSSQRDFVSSKVGCYIYNPVYTADLAAWCPK
jgi:peptide/nickel transport system substrate-binding protein